MKSSLAAPFLIAAAALTSTPALAGKLPPIKAGSKNEVPQCATPGRMLSLLKARNPGLDSHYEAVATEYMRHGEELGLRWDYAFYQMIVETGALTYRNGNKPGDVRPSQNNFAGLGATGKGEHGESFKDISSGVRAHLQHLMMYAGHPVADPVAERTRKVQEWGVLSSWQAKFKGGQITFGDMAQQWAPGSRGYTGMLEAIAEQFTDDFCKAADPRPELVQEARKNAGAKHQAVADARAGRQRAVKSETTSREETGDKVSSDKVSGADLYRRNVEEARTESGSGRAALGATNVARKDAMAQPTTIINTPQTEPEPREAAPVHTAAAGVAGAAKPLAPPATASTPKCNVFTASYGGQKAVIVKAANGVAVNYTVLDVNEGAEERETDAFIQAYAKGGQLVGKYQSQNQALDKAFELCPEG